MRTRLISSGLVLTLVLSGCMTFNGEELPKRLLPSEPESGIVIATQVGKITLLHNHQRGLKPPMSATGIANRSLTAVLVRWKGQGLIADYGSPGELEGDADYSLKIEGTHDEESSVLAAFVTGITLFLWPSSTTLVSSWRFELTDKRSDARFVVSTRNSVTTWMHLIFLPAFPIFWVGTYNADGDLSAYLYDELAKQGAWERAVVSRPASGPGGP